MNGSGHKTDVTRTSTVKSGSRGARVANLKTVHDISETYVSVKPLPTAILHRKLIPGVGYESREDLLSLGTMFVRISVTVTAVALLVDVFTLLLRRKALGAKLGGVPVRLCNVVESSHGVSVVISSSRLSNHPGQLLLWDQQRKHSVLLGSPESVPDGVAMIHRGLLSEKPIDLHTWKQGFLYGHIGQTPADIGLTYEEVSIGPNAFPAWEVRSAVTSRSAERWAIHIHGLGGARNQVLRGLPVFARNGYRSLVPTYDVSLDLRSRRKQSTLGFREWRAIAEAEDYAVRQGATQIVYVGWSFGALLALRVRHERHSPLVRGLVLISPALNWHRLIPRAMSRAGLPDLIVRLIMARFNGVIPRWGTPKAAWEEENHFLSTVAPLPMLVTHGDADLTVPLDHARETIQALVGPVKFVSFPEAQHGLEWNSNPTLWESTVEDWLNSGCLEEPRLEGSSDQPRSGL